MTNTTTQHVGTVKLYSDKGFGFLKPDQGGLQDVFVHASAVKAAGMIKLEVGQRVAFDLGIDHRGSKATHLRLIEVPSVSQV
jgi:CspA family cold shock protein